jgi:hypothetical protein
MMLAPAPAPAAHPDPVHRMQCLEQAARCRRLAYAVSDAQASSALLALAEDYERSAWTGKAGG